MCLKKVRGKVHRSLSQGDYHNLRKVSSKEDQKLAAGLRQHIHSMPPIEIIQQRGLRKLKDAAQKAPNKDQSAAGRGQER